MADETQMVTLRLPVELAAWATAYAKERGSSRTALLEAALVSFREDCLSGVPELRAAARAQSSVKTRGVGECPKNAGGHVWSSTDLERRPCVHCGTPGRGEGGFLDGASAARAVLFARLRAPGSVKGVTAAEKRDGA